MFRIVALPKSATKYRIPSNTSIAKNCTAEPCPITRRPRGSSVRNRKLMEPLVHMSKASDTSNIEFPDLQLPQRYKIMDISREFDREQHESCKKLINRLTCLWFVVAEVRRVVPQLQLPLFQSIFVASGISNVL
ncbi:hypothetical protein DPMN_186504 [Dreissena polymorpha]|uniref:Uncharacterized protein n=1 Tax=Dreissena polymorpha TaxID=45954 RepID=A0A9D4DPR5_DREPO|nr:hypothetical protein DPMN_186504 [Dreissena polymorpha]